MSKEDVTEVKKKLLKVDFERDEPSHLSNLPNPETIRRSSWIWGVCVTLGLAFLFWGVRKTELGQEFEDQFSFPLLFKARHHLGQGPDISPKLKLFLFDDKTFSYLQRPELNLYEWADFLEFIDSKNPKAIYIDQIFGVLGDTAQKKEEAFEMLKGIKTPIYTGSFASKTEIDLRPVFESSHARYSPERFFKEGHVSYFDLSHSLVYAAHPEFLPFFTPNSFHNVGFGRFAPLSLMKDNRVFTHLGLAGTKDLKGSQEGLVYDQGVHIPINSSGTSIINWASITDLFKRARPIKWVLTLMQDDRPLDYIQEEDHVLILPLAFTGNVDFIDTPFGLVYGGFLIASVLNSALTQKFINEVSYGNFFILLVSILCGLVSLIGGVRGWVGLSLILVAELLTGILCFVYLSIVFPWVTGLIGSFTTGVAVFAGRSRFEKMIARLHEQIRLDNEKLAEERAFMVKEKKEAAEIARAFVPDAFPSWPQMSVSGFHRCFDTASGDWFFFEASEDKKILHGGMCDITGHGVQAALVVSTCKTMLNAFKAYNPQAINHKDFLMHYMQSLNRILYLQGKGQHLTTFAALVFETEKNLVSHISCGHPAPLLFKSGSGDSRPKAIRSTHNPLGAFPEASGTYIEVPFESGDEIMLFTDGIPLFDNIAALKKFSTARMDSPNPPQLLYEMVLERMKKIHNKDADDDVSLVLFRHEGLSDKKNALENEESQESLGEEKAA